MASIYSAHAAVGEILKSFGSSSKVLYLTGSPGMGKSFAVQCLYRELIAVRGDQYWPVESIADPTLLVSNRSRLPPFDDDFTWTSGTLPTFSWWPMDQAVTWFEQASRDQEYLTPGQLHTTACAMASAKSQVGGQKYKKMLHQARAAFPSLAEDISAETVGVLAGAADVFLPGVGLAIRGLRLVGSELQRSTEQERLLHGEVYTATKESDFLRGRRMANCLAGFSSENFPAVVVLDHFHPGDLFGSGFLDGVKRVGGGGESTFRGVVVVMCAEHQERVAEYAGTDPIIDLGAYADYWNLHSISERLLPGVAAEIHHRVAERYSTPLEVSLFASLPWVRRRVGSGLLDDEDVARAPAAVDDLYRARIRSLDDRSLAALTVISQVSANSACREGGDSIPVPVQVVEGVLLSFEDRFEHLEGTTSRGPTLQQGVLGEWVTVESEAVHLVRGEFSKAVLEEFEDRFGPGETEWVDDCLAAKLTHWILDRAPDQEGSAAPYFHDGGLMVVSMAAVLHHPTQGALRDANPLIFASCALSASVVLRQVGRFDLAARVAQRGRSVLSRDSVEREILEHAVALCLYTAGRTRQAHLSYRRNLLRRRDRLGEFAGLTLESAMGVADCFRAYQQWEQAAGIYEYIIAKNAVSTTPISSMAVSNVHNSISEVFALSGQSARATEHARTALNIRLGVLGERHEWTLSSRANLAFARAAEGDSVEAIRQAMIAVKLTREVFGEGSEFSLNALNALGECQRLAKKFPEAVRSAEACYRGRVALMGSRHYMTLLAKFKLDFCRYKNGEIEAGDAINSGRVVRDSWTDGPYSEAVESMMAEIG